MLALSSSHISSIEFPLEDLIPTSHIDDDHQLNHIYRGNNTNNNNNDSGSTESSFAHLLDDPSHQQQQLELQQSPPSTIDPGDPTRAKKLSHNASERDRRKKINALYSSLRSILPGVDQMVHKKRNWNIFELCRRNQAFNLLVAI